MAYSHISRTITLVGRSRFSGSVAILESRKAGGIPEAVLVAARYGTSSRRVELAHASGLWELSIPSTSDRIIFQPQIRSIVVKTPKKERSIGFGDRSAVRVLGARLLRDATYRASSLAFFKAAVSGMIDAESQHNIHFPVLDRVIESRERFQEGAAGASKMPLGLRADKDKPGKGGWVGVEVPCFIQCMEECEEDAHWWEIWTHAACLLRCGIRCGTGGGKLYPD